MEMSTGLVKEDQCVTKAKVFSAGIAFGLNLFTQKLEGNTVTNKPGRLYGERLFQVFRPKNINTMVRTNAV